MIGPRIGIGVGPRLRQRVGLVDGFNGHASIALALTDSADPVNTNTNFNYSLVVTNVSAGTLASVSAVVTLHSSLTFVSGSGTGWTVGAVGQTVTCTRATLAVGAAPTLTITVTTGASANTILSIANATATAAPAAIQVAQSTVIVAPSVTTITVAIDDSADPVNTGVNFNYTTVVTNTGAIAATTVAAVVTLDASLAFVSGSGTGWSVSSFGQVITCTRATLAVGAAPTITITATAGGSALTALTTADATAGNAPNATQDTETTRIRATTTLTVAINDSADPVNVSANFNYTAVVTNTGSADAESVSAVLVLDASLTFVSGSGTGWTVNNVSGTVTCTRATLAAGAAPTITVTVTSGASPVTASTTLNANAANASGATQDTETTAIRALTTLTVALTDATDPVITAVNFAYSHIVTNTGAVTADNVSAPVVLDASLTFVSGSGTGWTVSHSAGTVTCTRATLAVGAAPTITITVTTGGSALTASSNANAIADNASAATQSTQTTVVKLVSKDATSGIRVPNTATEWSDFNAYHVAIGTSNFPNVAPASLWLLQEASGSLADSIGSVTLTSTMPTYQSVVSGWTRKGVQSAEGAAQSMLNITTAPNPSSTSVLLMAIVSIPASPAAQTDFMGVASNVSARHSANGKLRLSASATSDLVNVASGAVRPVLLQANRATTTAKEYTDQEKKSLSLGTPTNAAYVNFSNAGLNGATAGTFMYACEFTGASGELTDAQVKALLVACNWSIPWT